MSDLTIDTGLTKKILVGFIQSEIGKAGFSKAVIGLSGGIDSAVSCLLAVEALGPENVLAVRMPYISSLPESMDHAQLVINQTGVEHITVSITGMIDSLFTQFPSASKLRRGNAMARARMIILYDQSEAFRGLVVGTGNKTEILLGYSTIYGDSACALNPLGDLYKTQVRQLAREIGVPTVIVDKPPSADLWIGQTDEDELGFTYEEVDKLLYLLVDERYKPGDCIEAGFSEEFVNKVIALIRKNQFKQVMPPIASLGNRSTGNDFLDQ